MAPDLERLMVEIGFPREYIEEAAEVDVRPENVYGADIQQDTRVGFS